jgi:uncharacterized protein
MFVDAASAARFTAEVRSNRINAALLDRLPALCLPDCWLVAGCLFQTVWNLKMGWPAEQGISDYDVFYCDTADLSYEAEDQVIKRVAAAFADLDAVIEVKNQARVHLWYRQRFGHDLPRLTTSRDGIDRFLVAGTCVGVRCAAGQSPRCYTTYGFDDLYAGVLRPNPLNVPVSRFAEKAASYKARWPWLRVVSEVKA